MVGAVLVVVACGGEEKSGGADSLGDPAITADVATSPAPSDTPGAIGPEDDMAAGSTPGPLGPVPPGTPAGGVEPAPSVGEPEPAESPAVSLPPADTSDGIEAPTPVEPSPEPGEEAGAGGAPTEPPLGNGAVGGVTGVVGAGGSDPGTGGAPIDGMGGAAGDGYDSHCTRDVTEANKAVVEAGITAVFVNGNGAVIDDYWADPYLQHNPIATSGVATFKSFFSSVSPGFYSLTRLIGECDKVLIHGSYSGSGATFDMLRVEDERMVEHWDAASSAGLEGPTEVEDIELTGPNRDLVIGFVNDVMIGGNTEMATSYLAADLIEHGQGGSAGAEGFVQRVLDDGISYSTIHHQIADGNFVFTLSEGEASGASYGFYDLFRVADGMIVEHWDARLGVQDGASGLGIF
jgi:predicted SnoaL-like aldol condensation-catalyzing enzyme